MNSTKSSKLDIFIYISVYQKNKKLEELLSRNIPHVTGVLSELHQKLFFHKNKSIASLN